MDIVYKIITAIIFAGCVTIGALWTYRVKNKGSNGIKHYSYWFTIAVSFTAVFLFLFVYVWFW